MCLLAVHLLQCRSRLCLHPENGLLLRCFCRASLWLRRFLLVGRRQVEFAPSFPLWMESKALVKSTNNIVASRFFARTPSRIQRIVKICDLINRITYINIYTYIYISTHTNTRGGTLSLIVGNGISRKWNRCPDFKPRRDYVFVSPPHPWEK